MNENFRRFTMLSILLLYWLMQNIFAQNVSGQKIYFTVTKKYTDQIFVYYYKGPTMNDSIIMKLEDGLNLTQQEDFDIKRTTIFHYPGWGENASVGSSEAISTALLQKNISNIVVFDYSSLVRHDGNVINYVISVYNAIHIGQAIGEFIKSYIPEQQPPGLVKMVSHSMGAQIMAKVARLFGTGKLERLTALDPAGPIYKLPFVKHLNAADGKFVDIIHTDGGFFGDPRTVGTVDFFPNHGTRYQPGCDAIPNLEDLTSPCSHKRSYKYYAESILHPDAFLAKKCRHIFFFHVCCCNESDVERMGFYVDTSAHGTYFLKTNAQEPFGEGPEGIDF